MEYIALQIPKITNDVVFIYLFGLICWGWGFTIGWLIFSRIKRRKRK